jgi:hypothetical protein
MPCIVHSSKSSASDPKKMLQVLNYAKAVLTFHLIIFGKIPAERCIEMHRIGLLVDLKRNYSCSFCQFLHRLCITALPSKLLQALEEIKAALYIRGGLESWSHFLQSVPLDDFISPCAHLEVDRPGSDASLYLLPWVIWREDDAENRPPLNIHWRAVGEPLFSKFDAAMVNAWISLCEASHQQTCGTKLSLEISSEMFRPYLIDIDTRRIVLADAESVYIALSYAWGKTEEQSRNHSDIYQASSTASTYGTRWQRFLPETISRTVEDAIEVVKRFGLRYLWVDTYCINQASSPEKEHQIRNMDIIYEEAYLTIVALSGSSSETGLPGISVPLETFLQPKADLGSKTLIATRLPEFWSTIAESPWNARAWTMQEAALSKRRPCFTKENIFMICRDEIFHGILEPSQSAQIPTNQFRTDFRIRSTTITCSGISKYGVT